MNILDEVTIDFDLDSKILCDTPAKLKLRDKTLKGIHFNLNEEDGYLPKLRLAAKLRTITEEQASNLMNENNFVVTELDNVTVNDSDLDEMKKLRVSEEKSDALRKITEDLLALLRDAANDEVEMVPSETPVIQEVPAIDELPIINQMEEVNNNIEETEMPVIETYSEDVNEQPVIEVPVDEVVEESISEEMDIEHPEVTEITEIPEEIGYNVEPGDEGVVSSIEPVEIPVTVEEQVQEISNISEEIPSDLTAFEKANNNEIFKKNLEIIQGNKDLEKKEKEGFDLLTKERERRQDIINTSLELDKTHAERQIKITELQDNFNKLVAKQYEENEKRRAKILENISNNDSERQKVQDEISQYEEMNKDKYKMIEEADKEILKYEELIRALESDNSEYYQEEPTLKKVA